MSKLRQVPGLNGATRPSHLKAFARLLVGLAVAVGLPLLAARILNRHVYQRHTPQPVPFELAGGGVTNADMRAAEESTAVLERFLRQPTPGPFGVRLPQRDEAQWQSDWAAFYTEFGNFLGWAKTDSPSEAYTPGVHRYSHWNGGYTLGIVRDAQFQKGTVKLNVIVEAGATDSGKPVVLWVIRGAIQSSGLPTRTITVRNPDLGRPPARSAQANPTSR